MNLRVIPRDTSFICIFRVPTQFAEGFGAGRDEWRVRMACEVQKVGSVIVTAPRLRTP